MNSFQLNPCYIFLANNSYHLHLSGVSTLFWVAEALFERPIGNHLAIICEVNKTYTQSVQRHWLMVPIYIPNSYGNDRFMSWIVLKVRNWQFSKFSLAFLILSLTFMLSIANKCVCIFHLSRLLHRLKSGESVA